MSEHNSSNTPSQNQFHVRQPAVMLSDLTADLLWPRVLRAPALALSPSRLITGSVCAFLLALVLQLATSFTAGEEGTTTESAAEIQSFSAEFNQITSNIGDSFRTLDPLGVAQNIGLAAETIRDMVMHSPIISLILGIPLIAILAISGGAIARSTAIEFAQGRFTTRDDTLGFTLKRTRQLVGAVVGPIIFCALIFLLIATAGLLLSVPVLDVVGSILYAIGLLLGILATLVLMLHILALPLIVPALTIEGTDAFDAIQRSYAYVIGKPLRYLTYGCILIILGALSTTIFTIAAQTSIAMTDWAASFFASDSATRVLTGEGELGATKSWAHFIIGLWRSIVELAIAGYIISVFFTSSSLLYLVVRRFCDGQGINEIWEEKAS